MSDRPLTRVREGVRRRLVDLALRTNVLRGNDDYTRFIVLARSRTGSSYLRGLLNSHTHVVAFRELFKQKSTIEWGLPGYRQSERLVRVRREDPIAFLETQVFRRYPRPVAAVGFTIFYGHAQTGGWEPLWEHLQSDVDLHVVHLTRRNLLRSYLSRMTARSTDEWISPGRAPAEAPPIALDHQACVRQFEHIRASEREFAARFTGHPLIDVVYEDLADDHAAEMRRVETALGLEHQELRPTTLRQSNRPLASAISNYDELRDRFRGSPWESFFD